MKRTIAVVLYAGANELDVVGPWEVFATLRRLAPALCNVCTVAAASAELRGAKGLRLRADHTFESSPRADILLVPGGLTPDSAARPWHRARLLTSAGILANLQGDLAAARPLLEEAVSLWRQLDDPASLARLAAELGFLLFTQGDHAAARSLIEEGIAASRRAGRREFEALHVRQLGHLTWIEGDLGAARRLAEQALGLATEVGYDWGIGLALVTLGLLDYEARQLPAARQRFEAALGRFEQVDEAHTTSGTATARAGLGHVATEQGDFVLARTLFGWILREGQRSGGSLIVLTGLHGFAHVAAAEGQAERAARLCGMVTSVLQPMVGRPHPMWRHLQGWLASASAQLGERRASMAYAAGAAATLEEAISFALGEERPAPRQGATHEWLALTPREREIVVLLHQGLSNRDIAERLVVGERTVETHVHNVLCKLGLRSRHQIADWASSQQIAA
jgi:DNA-binding CsgD family transcriptional regulator/tetratricopeptide (TPR) repeat protein